jgi:hypothetical protein
MVMCVEPGKTWCVGQLSADRAKPFILFPDMVYSSEAEATKAAETLKAEKAESVPCRNI